MTVFFSRCAAPIAGAVFLALAGAATGAVAAPGGGAIAAGAQQSEPARAGLIHKADHRGGPGRGGWHGGSGGRPAALGPRQIRRSLRHRGFYRIRIMDRRGPVYIVKAIGWRGMPVRLVVDARTADIVRSRTRGGGFSWSYSW